MSGLDEWGHTARWNEVPLPPLEGEVRDGLVEGVRAGLACAVVKIATSSNSAKRIDAFLMGFTSFLCVFTLSNDEVCRFWTPDRKNF